MTADPDLDAWALIDARCDPGGFRPRLAPGVELRRFDDQRSGPYAMICNPQQTGHLRLTSAEADLVEQLDGTRSVASLVAGQVRDQGTLGLGPVASLVRALEAGGFLASSFVDIDAAVRAALAPPTWRSRSQEVLRTLRVEWGEAERLVAWLYRRGVRAVFHPLGALLAAAVAVAGAASFAVAAAHRPLHFASRRVGVTFAVLFALDLAVVFVHELGHASVLVHHRRRVRSAGFRLYFGAPSFFVDSTDALMLPRRQRILQSFAGPAFEAVAAGLCGLALWVVPDGPAADALYSFILVNYYVLLLNLVPLLELDGYWILCDALGVADLRARSLGFVRRELGRKVRRRERFSRAELGLALYGTVGLVFSALCLGSAWFFWRRVFGDAVSRLWHAGWAGRIALVVLAGLLGGPAIRALFDAARSVLGWLGARIDALRFRLQQRWRIEAAELLDQSGTFGDLPVDVLNDLAGRVELQPVAPGERVVRQGEVGDAYYLIRRGTFEVLDEPDGQEPAVRVRLGRGDGFGEAALLHTAPRNASVRSVGRGQVFRVAKGTFDALLANHAGTGDVHLTLQRRLELAALPPFRHLDDAGLTTLATAGSWLPVPAGHDIVVEGDAGDAFYVLGAGQAEVRRGGRPVDTMGPGAHFGESALLTDQPRNATVTATTACRVFRLPRAGFEVLLAQEFHHGRMRPPAPARVWDH